MPKFTINLYLHGCYFLKNKHQSYDFLNNDSNSSYQAKNLELNISFFYQVILLDSFNQTHLTQLIDHYNLGTSRRHHFN